MTIDGTFTANPDGSYREEMIIQGQLAGFWEGTYTLSSDGMPVQTETSKSPQLCSQSQYQANDGASSTTSQSDNLERDGIRYPLKLQGTLERLNGSFSADGNAFPVPLGRAGDSGTVAMGNARFELTPAASQPVNPLGN